MTKNELIKALKGVKGETEIRFSTKKNPPRSLYCVEGVEKTAMGIVLYAG